MAIVGLTNSRTQSPVAENVRLANTFWLRLRGLLGRPELKPGEGLWLIPCKQVHMHGMNYPLSVWFLDREGKVCHIIDELKPGKTSPYIKDAHSVLEFPAHWAATVGIKIGDLIQKSPNYSQDLLYIEKLTENLAHR